MSQRLVDRENTISQVLNLAAPEISKFVDIQCYDVLQSTMDQARELLNSEKIDCAIVIDCKNQTAGRGRQGRSWLAMDDALKFTYLRISPNSNSLGLPLIVACTIHQVIASWGGETLIKWPNDILSKQGEKLAGILVERLTVRSKNYDLIGIGINSYTKPEIDNSSCLSAIFKQKLNLDLFYVQLIVALYNNLEDFYRVGLTNLHSYWLDNTYPLGTEISFTADGSKHTGRFAGLSPTGALILDVAGSKQEFFSGDFQYEK